jgi:hypothetical protein
VSIARVPTWRARRWGRFVGRLAIGTWREMGKRLRPQEQAPSIVPAPQPMPAAAASPPSPDPVTQRRNAAA